MILIKTYLMGQSIMFLCRNNIFQCKEIYEMYQKYCHQKVKQTNLFFFYEWKINCTYILSICVELIQNYPVKEIYQK